MRALCSKNARFGVFINKGDDKKPCVLFGHGFVNYNKSTEEAFFLELYEGICWYHDSKENLELGKKFLHTMKQQGGCLIDKRFVMIGDEYEFGTFSVEEHTFSRDTIIYDRFKNQEFLVLEAAGICPQNTKQLIFLVKPVRDWLAPGETPSRFTTFDHSSWDPASASPMILDDGGKPFVFRPSDFTHMSCTEFNRDLFLSVLKERTKHWRFGKIEKFYKRKYWIGEHEICIAEKNVQLLTRHFFETINLETLHFDKPVVYHDLDLDKQAGTLVKNGEKKPVLKPGDWLCYSICKKWGWDFVQSSKELLHFVKWIKEPSEKFPKGIWFGPFYPFVLAYYKRPYKSREVDCFIRDLLKK